jgi:transposase
VWRREAKGKGLAVPGDGKNAEGWSSEDKFAVVLETAPLNAAELAEYCRRKGLYPEQIAAWRASCVAANANAVEQGREQRQQSKEDKQRIKQLEKELHRKEKALAEAAALLVLRKKSMVTPVFATLIFDGVVGLLKSIRRRYGEISPRHDESRA